jgi:hypothetical protein
MRFLKRTLTVVIVFVIIYVVGPQPSTPVFKTELTQCSGYQQWTRNIYQPAGIATQDQTDNEARIVWANDSLKQKTEYAIVYLHGFSASQEEGNPVHRNIAKQFGCNLYLSRLSQHGVDTTDALLI